MTTRFMEFYVTTYSITPTKLQYKELPWNRSKVNFEDKSFLYVTSKKEIGQRKMFSQKIWTSTFQSSESFRSFFKTKVLLGIYQEDFFLILETFLSGEERVFLLQVETFAEQASSLALFSKICSTLKHRKCQNPPKILLWNERNSFERRGWLTEPCSIFTSF